MIFLMEFINIGPVYIRGWARGAREWAGGAREWAGGARGWVGGGKSLIKEERRHK